MVGTRSDAFARAGQVCSEAALVAGDKERTVDTTDEVLGLAKPQVVTTSAGIDSELDRLMTVHRIRATRTTSWSRRNTLLVIAGLVAASFGGAAVGAAATNSNPGLIVIGSEERTVAMTKKLPGGTCTYAWHIVGAHPDEVARTVSFLSHLDTTTLDPDAEWRAVLDNVPSRQDMTPLERDGQAFMMAVSKLAWSKKVYVEGHTAVDTMTNCTEAD